MRRSLNGKSISGIKIMRGCFGFTILELIVVIIIIGIIAAIALSIYNNFINNAKVTVAISTLDNARKTLTDYNVDHGGYPASIDFSSCVDGQGNIVFHSGICDQIKKDLVNPSYSTSPTGYLLTAKAKDNKQTLLTLTESNITK